MFFLRLFTQTWAVQCVSSYLNETFLQRIHCLVSLHPQLFSLNAQFSLLNKQTNTYELLDTYSWVHLMGCIFMHQALCCIYSAPNYTLSFLSSSVVCLWDSSFWYRWLIKCFNWSLSVFRFVRPSATVGLQNKKASKLNWCLRVTTINTFTSKTTRTTTTITATTTTLLPCF